MLNFNTVKKTIIESLSPDLLEPKWRALVKPGDPPESGHCAVATEAFYHLAGGKAAGLMPAVCVYHADEDGNRVHEGAVPKDFHRETHWWVRGPKNGQRGKGGILDVTAGQYDGPFPYEYGHNIGFMQPQQKPSKRAQVVIDRVTARLGKEALAEYRRHNIAAYHAAQKKAGLKLKM